MLLALVSVASAVTVRAVYDGETALLGCDEALRAGDRATATARGREAAAWYVPGAPHVGAAYARLIHIARTAEAEGDREAALYAWRAVRTAVIDSTWMVPSHEGELSAANRAIARLSLLDPTQGSALPEDRDAERSKLESLLARRERARTPYVVLLLGAFVLLVVSGLAQLKLARRKISSPGPIALALVGLAAYAAAIWLA